MRGLCLGLGLCGKRNLVPSLNNLTFSSTTFTAGTPSSGTINGATAGSTITASGLPTGLTIDGAARTWAWDGTGTAGTGSFTLTETLAGYTNSPRVSTVGYTIAAAAPSAPVNTVAPAISGDPVVGQRLYASTGTWTNSPTSYAYQWKKDGTNIPGETADNYLVVDADIGSTFACVVTATNAGGSTAQASSSTAAATAINLTNAITALARTSASGTTPMTFSLSLGSNVYAGYTLRADVYSDSGLSTLIETVYHTLTEADMAGGAIDWTSDGLSVGATEWLKMSVQTTSPSGLFYDYSFGTAISPTDAVPAMVWSTTDKDPSVTVSGGSLTAGNVGSNVNRGIRANRGLTTGKLYWELKGTFPNGAIGMAVANGAAALNTAWGGAGSANPNVATWQSNAQAWFNNVQSLIGNIASNDDIDIALDLTSASRKIWWRKNNGGWLPTGDPTTGTGGITITSMGTPVYPAANFFSSGAGTTTANFGPTFTRTPPTGFTAP